MHDQSITSSSLPINLILVTGERRWEILFLNWRRGGSPGQKIVGLFFPLRKTLVGGCQDCYPTGSGALEYYFSILTTFKLRNNLCFLQIFYNLQWLLQNHEIRYHCRNSLRCWRILRRPVIYFSQNWGIRLTIISDQQISIPKLQRRITTIAKNPKTAEMKKRMKKI